MLKKISVVFTIILGSFLGLFACGDPYKDMSLSLSSYEANLEEEITLLLEEDEEGNYTSSEIKITAVVSGAGDGVSNEVIFPNETLNNKYVGVKDIRKDGDTTTFVLYGKERGKTKLEFKAEGIASQKIDVNVELGIKDLEFKENAINPIAEGDSVNLKVNLKSYIKFTPENTSQDEVVFTIDNVNTSAQDACAKIEDGILKTVKGALYPTDVNGVKVLTLRATSKTNPSLTDTFDIPVLSITDSIKLTTNNYSTNYPTIELNQNSNGKYELVMTPLLSTAVEDPDLQYFMSNRNLSFEVGNSVAEHNKYLITCTMPQNEYLTVTKINNSDFNSNYTNYQIIANKASTEPVIVSFDIDYVGSIDENPTGDINKFKGLFTKTIEIAVKITTLPSSQSITVNNSYDSEVSIDVYDYYYGIDGTYLKISEKLTDLNLTYKINYYANGYEEGISKNTLSIYTNGEFVDDDHVFHNNDVLYLKHYYSNIDYDKKPYLEVVFSYTFLPEGSQDVGYETLTITKKINLNFYEGIKEVEIQDVNLEVSKREKVVLYTFPVQMNARENVRNITSSNNDLFEITYEKNVVYITANDDMVCGLASGLRLITSNGTMSNLATVRVYMSSMYSETSQLYSLLSSTNPGDVLYAGVPAEGEERTLFNGSLKTATISDDDGQEYQYEYFDTLALKTNNEYVLDVYHLMAKNNLLYPVYENMDVVLTGTKTGVLEWNQEDGTLTTYNEITGLEPIQVDITLKAYDDAANAFFVTNTIYVYIFESLTSAELDVSYKEISIANNIGLYDQLNNEDKFVTNVLAYSSNGFVQEEDRLDTFGKLDMQVEISREQLDTILYQKGNTVITLADLIKGSVNDSLQLTAESSYEISLEFRLYNLVKEAENIWYETNVLSSGEIDSVLKNILGDGLRITGNVVYSQFGRNKNMPFEVCLIYREKVKNIITNINTTTGIDFEFKGNDLPNSQSITYTVFPSNAFNKDFNVIVKDQNGKEIHTLVNGKCNICDCPFKEIKYNANHVCDSDHLNGGKHISYVNCKANGLNITINNGKIKFEITKEINGEKLNVYLVPHDAYKPAYKMVDDVRTLINYSYDYVTHFVIHVTDGSLDAPFQIRDERDFITMLSDIKNGLNTFHYEQVNDINLSSYDLFNLIKDIEFKGSYNGAFKNSLENTVYTLINGVKITGTLKEDSNIGLFGTLSGVDSGNSAFVQNVNINNAVVNITTDGNITANVGLIAGMVGQNAYISSSRVSSNSFTVDNENNTSNITLNVGAIAGSVNSNGGVSGSYIAIGNASLNNASLNSAVAMRLGVKENDIIHAGGVAGTLVGYVSDQDVSVNITYSSNATLNAGSSTGGVVGYAVDSTITNVKVVPYIIGRANVGGVLGYGQDTQITDSCVIMTHNSNTRNIIAGQDIIGGIVGQLSGGSVAYSYIQSLSTLAVSETYDYTGANYCGNVVVFGENYSNIGGIIGYIPNGSVTINAVMFKGDIVSYNSDANVSGIANYDNSIAEIELNDFMILGNIYIPVTADYNMLVTSTKTFAEDKYTEQYANATIGKGYIIVNNLYGIHTSSDLSGLFSYVTDTLTYDFAGLGATNGIFGVQDGNVVKDSIGVDIYEYDVDSETRIQRTNWLINPSINNGLPVLIRLNNESTKLEALFSSVATINATVLDYVPVVQEPIDIQTQGHIKINDTNLVLFYNKPVSGIEDNYLNTYYIQVVEDGEFVDSEQDIIELNFTALSMDGTLVSVDTLKDYRLTSSSEILTVGGQVEINGSTRYELLTSGVGTATLIFTNIYDESNTIKINVEIIKGLKEFAVYKTENNVKLTQIEYDNDGKLKTEISESSSLQTYVDFSKSYRIAFENIINGTKYDAYNLGGFSLQLRNASAQKPQFKLGAYIIDCNTVTSEFTQVAEFDNISNLSLQGLSEGYVEAKMIPYIYYYGEKVYLENLSIYHFIRISDKAQSLEFTSENSVTIKPEANVDDVYFELVTSNLDEIIMMNITENGKAIIAEELDDVYYRAGEIKTNLLDVRFERVSEENIVGTTLYKVIYKLTLKMDKKAYFDIIAQNKHDNPLKRSVTYGITLTAASNELASDTYSFTIEPNELESIKVGLYPNIEYNVSSSAWEIDTTTTVTNKLAPNQRGMLQIATVRDYNNVAYVEITTNVGSHVSLQQVRKDVTALNNITFISLDNNAIVINNGLRLWNVSNNGELPFNSMYYVMLSVDETIKQGETLIVYVNAFDHNGNLMDVNETYEIHIENLPSVDVKVNGLIEDVLPINTYIPVDITSEHIERITYKFESAQAGKTIPANTIALYTFDGESYTKYNSTILDLTQKYYVNVSKDLKDFTKLKLTIIGEKLVNGFDITDEATLTIEPALFTVEDVSIDGTLAENTLFLYTSTSKTLSANVIMNESAMEVVSKYYYNKDKDGYYSYVNGAVVSSKLSDYEKTILKDYYSLNKIISGQDSVTRLNYWNILDGTSYKVLEVGKSYSNNFRFYQHEEIESLNISYRVEALGIASSELRFDAKFFYKNGKITFVDTNEMVEFGLTAKTIMHDFTLTVLDNSTRDNPNPIFTQEDLTKLQVDEKNTDEDGNIVRPHYILMNDLILENWKPIKFTASSFDGNSYVIKIKSFDFSDYKSGNTVSTGLFTEISEYSVMKNVIVDVSGLLVADGNNGNSNIDFTAKYDAEGKETFTGKTNVEFGLITPQNNGTITNTKVVNTDESKKNSVLYVKTTQGVINGNVCTAYISPFVVNNAGSITYSFVGLSAVGNNASGVSKISCATDKNVLEQKEVYSFAVYGGNNLAGFVVNNSNLISTCYVRGVSFKNLTNINKNSSFGGFVGTNNGRINSSFVSTDKIVNNRPTNDAHYLEGKGYIGGFAYENGTNGVIENCYAIMLIVNNSVETGGFVYVNGGQIKNAYTTTIAKLDNNTFSEAHGWFVGDKAGQGTLENCYYYIKNGEIGLDVDFNDYYYDDNILKTIDPATPIFDLSKDNELEEKDRKNYFTEEDNFDGFVFGASYGSWTMDDNLGPLLNDCASFETMVHRKLAGILDKDGNNIEIVDGVELPEDVVYNYTYVTDYGTQTNPVVINSAQELVEEIVGKSKQYDVDGDKLTIFGFDVNKSMSPEIRYVRLINNIDFTNIALNNTYPITSEHDIKCKLSDIIFNGVLVGNGMELSGIKLNNTSEQIVEDFGLFKQIGLSGEQKQKLAKVVPFVDADNIINPLVYNLNIEYDEVKYKNARKVGVLAGSIYDATMYMVNLEGKKESVSVENATILGQNLVGGLAGFIAGENTNISFVTLKNIKAKANNNPTANITNEYEDLYGFYNSYTLNGDIQKVVKSQTVKFGSLTSVANLSSLSYAGGVAGLINIGDNIPEKVAGESESEEPEKNDKFDYDKYHVANEGRRLNNLTISENIDIRADQAGGLFGGMYDSRMQLSNLVLMEGQNNDSSYQTIFGYNYAGGLVGELNNSVLDQVTVEHVSEKQLEIDNNIAKADSVSKDDLFKISSGSALNVSIAIGGLAGYSKDSAIVFSASKVNVTNEHAKIAGGLVGYAEDYNYLGYSFTTGSVIANDVFGGLVGFYLNKGYDYYLFNAYASNVWTSDVLDVLQINTHAIQSDGNFTDVRMPEIGNLLARTTDGSIVKKTNDISAATFAEPEKFVYAGSVFGKISLRPNDKDKTGKYNSYNIDGNKITIKDDGTYFIGDTEPEKNALSVKNLFVFKQKTTENLVCYNGTKPIAIALFDASEKVMSLEKVVSHTEFELNVYYKYYNKDYTSNVFSTVYSKISTSGNIESGNRNTVISNDSVKLITEVPEKVGVEKIESDEVNAKNIRYDNVLGAQYYLSYITGDYYVSNVDASNYAKFDNEFEDLAFLPNEESNYDSGNSIRPSNIWYLNNQSLLPSYMVGKNAKLEFVDDTETIDFDGELSELFDKTLYPESSALVKVFENNQDARLAGGRYLIHLDGTNVYKFNRTYTGTINGSVDSEGNNLTTITILYYCKDGSIARNSMLFKFLQNAKFYNVNIELVLQDKSIWSTGDSSGYFGLIAPSIDGVVFKDSNFTLKYASKESNSLMFNNSNTSSGGTTYYPVKYAGLVFGKMYNTSITNCSLVIDDGVSTLGKNLIGSSLNRLGGFAADVESSTITNLTHGIDGETLCKSDNDKNLTHVGGLFAKVSGDKTKISGLNQASRTDGDTEALLSPIIFTTFETTPILEYLGGVVGEMSGGALSDVCLTHTWNYALQSSGDINVGGVAGSTNSTEIVNIALGGRYIVQENKNILVYDNAESGKHALSLTIKEPDSINFGGLIGQLINSNITGEFNNGKYILNNNDIILSAVEDASKTEVNLGGLIGFVKTSGSIDNAISYALNTGKINIERNNITALNVGGILGCVNSTNRSAFNISSVYSAGDILAYGTNKLLPSNNVKLGGVVGYTKVSTGSIPTIKNTTTYCDIVYGISTYNVFASGVIGFSDVTLYNYNSVFVFTQIRPVSVDGWNANKILISPFVNGSNVAIIENCLFVNEHYLNVADSESEYSNSGVWLSDLYAEFKTQENELNSYKLSDKGKELQETTSELSQSAMLLTKTYQQDGMPELAYTIIDELTSDIVDLTNPKFNIKYLSAANANTTINSEVTGYNIVLDNLTVNGTTNVGVGAILTAQKSVDDFITISFVENGSLNLNAGSISNFAVNLLNNKNDKNNFMNANLGYVYNVVVYGEETEMLVTDYASFANTNNGLITQCGVNITYSVRPATKVNDLINFSGFVGNNNGEIRNCYSVNNVLYCNMFENLSSVGIASANTGKINNVFVGGNFTNNELNKTAAIAKSSTGQINGYFVDTESVNENHGSFAVLTGLNSVKEAGSLYQIFENAIASETVDESGNVKTTYIWNTNNTKDASSNLLSNIGLNYRINSGFPYINGGIKLPTITNFDGSKLTFYNTESQGNQNTLVITSLRDFVVWANITGSNSFSNFNVYFTQNIDAKSYDLNTEIYSIQNGYKLYGNYYILKNFKLKSNSIFTYNYGTIQNITIKEFSVDSDRFSNSSILTYQNRGAINNVTIKDFTINTDGFASWGGIANINTGKIIDCTIDYANAEVVISTNGQLGGGGITYQNKGEISGSVVKNLKLSTTSSSPSLGGVVAVLMSGSSITSSSVESSTITGVNNVGGLAGSVEDTNVDISDSIVKDSTITGKSFVGGLIGGRGKVSSESPIGKYYCPTCNIYTDNNTCPNNPTHFLTSSASLSSTSMLASITSFNDSGAGIKNTNVKFSGFIVDKNQGWFTKNKNYSEGRFQGRNLSDIGEEVFGDGGYYGKYRRDFDDENLTTDNWTWYSPTNGNSGNGNVENDFYTSMEGGHDDSVYYTTIACVDSGKPLSLTTENIDPLFKKARGYNNKEFKYNVGLLYGFEISGYKAKTDSLSEIKATDDIAENVKIEGKIVLDAFTHWFYLALEGTGERRGMLVMEFIIYFDTTAESPYSSGSKTLLSNIVKYGFESDCELLDINFAYDYQYGVKFNNDWGVELYARINVGDGVGAGKYYSVKNKFKNVVKLFTGMRSDSDMPLVKEGNGIIQKFMISVKQTSELYQLPGLTELTGKAVLEGGRYWVDGTFIQKILDDCGYIGRSSKPYNDKLGICFDYLNEPTYVTTGITTGSLIVLEELGYNGNIDSLYVKVQQIGTEYQLVFYQGGSRVISKMCDVKRIQLEKDVDNFQAGDIVWALYHPDDTSSYAILDQIRGKYS